MRYRCNKNNKYNDASLIQIFYFLIINKNAWCSENISGKGENRSQFPVWDLFPIIHGRIHTSAEKLLLNSNHVG